MKRLIVVFLLAAAAAAAAGIDGRWTAQVVRKQAAPARGGPVDIILKTDGGRLSGTVQMPGGRKPRPIGIRDGKLEGDSFSFTTVRRTKKAEHQWTWRGTLRGDELSGTRTREGARRGQPFTAKRAG